MPDGRRHRGPHSSDAQLFAPDKLAALRAAVGDMGWLLGRGYATRSALQLVGNRYQLAERQQLAVMRSSCSQAAATHRKGKEVLSSALRDQNLHIDGYNVLTTIEAALSGAWLFQGCDGCWRDIASMHGTFRRVEETVPAIEAVGAVLHELGVAQAVWYLDRPVSNSGRLREMMLQIAAGNGWNWRVEIVMNPDPVLAVQSEIIATSDSVILDACARWFNLTRLVVQKQANPVKLVRLDAVDWQVRQISAAHTLPLRQEVLRPGRPLASAFFEGDEAADTFHLGAVVEGEIIGIASLFHQSPPQMEVDGAWQLRGMAVAPGWQRRGCGAALVEACVWRVVEQGGTLLWCNARREAEEFYRGSGFEVQSEEFLIPDVGPHVVMSREVRKN